MSETTEQKNAKTILAMGDRIGKLEEALRWWIAINEGAPNKYDWAEEALKE